MRRTFVDTIVTVVFFTVLAAITEFFIGGLDVSQVVTTRLVMIPMMVLTGRPYGIWRDWFFRSTKPTVSWSKTLIDGAAFLTFQLPIYAATLLISGVEGYEVLILLGSTSIFMLLVSRPFGLILEFCRRWAGVSGSAP